MEEPPLRDLCLICHTNVPKYRCPRCSLRTCSLTCSQRHKVRAQCSGVRDPAAYIKKSELTTPAAIDRDFNFLVGVERFLDRAEQDVRRPRIPSISGPERRRGAKLHPIRGGPAVAHALLRADVMVEPAPRGLRRHTENQTNWDARHQCLSWTVEWMDETGRRTLVSALDTRTVQEAYHRSMVNEPRRASRRRRTKVVRTPSSDPNECRGTPGEVECDGSSSLRSFYLLRPQTAASNRVIIPVSGSSPIVDCLRGQVVLEFPTFYALPASDPLPAGLMTDDDYRERCQKIETAGTSSPGPAHDVETTTVATTHIEHPEQPHGIPPEADLQHIWAMLTGRDTSPHVANVKASLND